MNSAHEFCRPFFPVACMSSAQPIPAPTLVSPAIDLRRRAPQLDAIAPVRLGILASGSGTNFEAIAAACAQGQIPAQIAVVIYNNPGAMVADRATRLGIPAVLLDHRQFDSREALDDALIAALRQAQVDWVVMAGWMRRVTQVLIDAFPRRILNIHPSLLPSFPGLKAVDQAIAAGVKIAGCTVHYVELAVDSGPIVMQAAVPVLADDTVATLQARIQQQEHQIFPAAIALAIQSAQFPV